MRVIQTPAAGDKFNLAMVIVGASCIMSGLTLAEAESKAASGKGSAA